MALTTEITAKLYEPIGLIGQNPIGFIDFTKAELQGNGNIQTVNRTFSFPADPVINGITNPTLGKLAIVNQTDVEVTDYLDTIFTDPTKTYLAKTYILCVSRKSKAITGALDVNSSYVDRNDYFYVDVRINISVT
jgi:hypothetical protein